MDAQRLTRPATVRAELAAVRSDVQALRAEVAELRRALARQADQQPARLPAAELGGRMRRAEAAQLLGVSPNTLAMWGSRGIGPPFMLVGHRAYYRTADIRRCIDQKGAPQGAAGGDRQLPLVVNSGD